MGWNLVDLTLAAFRRGKGVSPKAHVFADCVLAVGIALSACFVLVDISDWVGDQHRGHVHHVEPKIAIACLLLLVMYVAPSWKDSDWVLNS